MNVKKIIITLIAIVIYLAIGINQGKFQYNAYDKHPEERNFVERVVTLQTFSSSEEARAIYIERYEIKQEGIITFEDLSLGGKATYALLWFPAYLILVLSYSLALVLYLKWVILAIVAMALYSNFGWWLGSYVYEKSTTTPNLLTKFLTINNSKVFSFNWERDENYPNLTKKRVQVMYAFFWPFFLTFSITVWSIFTIYKFIKLIYKTVKGILWLIFAGPARDGWSK